jgi:hypothetical protein
MKLAKLWIGAVPVSAKPAKTVTPMVVAVLEKGWFSTEHIALTEDQQRRVLAAVEAIINEPKA